MKDLLLLTADADAAEFLRAAIGRHSAMGTRAVTVCVQRNPGRDSGMVQHGAALAGLAKGQYSKTMLVLDHHGCGREFKLKPNEVEQELQDQLDRVTWAGHSCVVVVEPELEAWLWHCRPALAAHWRLDTTSLAHGIDLYAARVGKPIDEVLETQPKEIFEFIAKHQIRTTISPRDFQSIGTRASIPALSAGSPSFARLRAQLQQWFP